MHKIKIILILIACLTCFSCTRKIYTARQIPIEEAKAIQHRPLIANLNVNIDKKVEGEVYLKGRGDLIEAGKLGALADALNKSGADVVVDPIYEITKKGRKMTCKVTGYYADYSNVTTITREDIELMKLYKDVICEGQVNREALEILRHLIYEKPGKKGMILWKVE